MEDADLKEAEATLEASESVVINEDGTYTVTLAKPVKYKKDFLYQVTSIDPETMTVSHLQQMDRAKGEVAQALELVAAVFDLGGAVVRRMHPADFKLLGLAAGVIMGKPPSGGGQASQET